MKSEECAALFGLTPLSDEISKAKTEPKIKFKTNKTKPLEVQIGINTLNIRDQGFDSDHLDVQNHMDQLALKNKAVLEAIFFFGMTQREVAEFLNIPLGTVKSRLRIGLKELGTIYHFKQ